MAQGPSLAPRCVCMLGPPSLLVVALTTILILARAVHGLVSTRLRQSALLCWSLMAMTTDHDKQAVDDRAWWEALLVQAHANRSLAEATLAQANRSQAEGDRVWEALLLQAKANETTSRGLQCLIAHWFDK